MQSRLATLEKLILPLSQGDRRQPELPAQTVEGPAAQDQQRRGDLCRLEGSHGMPACAVRASEGHASQGQASYRVRGGGEMLSVPARVRLELGGVR